MPPSPVEDINQKATELLHEKADKGDKNGLSQELNNMTMADQMAVVKEMKSIRDQERTTNKDLPKVEFVSNTDSGGREHLQNVEMVSPGRFWGENRTDVYDPPKDNVGNGMLSQAQNAFRDRNRQLAEALGDN